MGGLIGTLVTGLLAAAPAAGAADPVRVTWFVGLGTNQDKEQKRAIEGLVDDFNAANQDIRLDVRTAPGARAHDRLGDLLQSGGRKSPDIVGPMGLREFTGFEDAWLDLAPLAGSTGYDLAAFEPGLLDLYRRDDGALVGLPFAAYPSLTYYNEDLFDAAGLAYPPAEVGANYVMPDGQEAPWDYETVAELARLLTLDANGNDANSPDFDPDSIVQWGFGAPFPDIRRDVTAVGGVASLLNDAGDGPRVVVPAAWREASAWLWDMTFVDHSRPTTEQSEALGGEPFGSGRAAMAVAPLWYTCCLADAAGTRLERWDLGIPPTSLSGTLTSPLHSDALSIAASTDAPAASFAVLRYLLESDAARLVWTELPAQTEARGRYYASFDQAYPGAENWSTADALLAYPDIPSHQQDLPAFEEIQERLSRFADLLYSEAGAGVDIDTELDTLEADLQAIVGGGDTEP